MTKRCVLILAAVLLPGVAMASLECSPEFAKSLKDPDLLRALKDKCEDNNTFAAAIATLNSLPPPSGPSVNLRQAPVQTGSIARAVLEAEVYFDVFESYPPDQGVRRLRELVERASGGFRIERIEIRSAADHNEEQVTAFRIAERRAAFVRNYFVNSGVPPGLIWTASRGAFHPDTPEGRARDRIAAIRIVILRERTREGT